MKKEFESYLSDVGMGGVLIERVRDIDTLVSSVLPEEVTHIFVGEYLDSEGTRQFENLYFLTPGYLVELRNFVSGDTTEFEVDLIRDSIINVMFVVKEYNFQQASDASRLNFRYTTGPLGAELKASKGNCDHLFRIIRDCLLPNLRTAPVQDHSATLEFPPRSPQ